ncbi:MAG: hypothetical protein GY940_15225 [bacterium]|nr:hypothetical protein [bacterium]
MKKTGLDIKWQDKWTVGLLILCIGLIYFIYLPVDYDFDGTVFSSYLRYALVEGGVSDVVQPHHPLYFPVNYAIYKVLNQVTGYRVLEYFHLQLFSLLFGLLTLWISYRIVTSILVKETGRRFFLLTGPIFIAVSYGTWYYAVQAEVHMPGLFFTSLGFYLLFFKPGSGAGEKDSLSRTLGASLCFAAAAGFHLANGLIAVSVLLIFLVEREPIARILRFFSFYIFFLLAGLMTLGLAGNVNLLEHFKNQLLGNDPMAGYTISYWSGGFSPAALWDSLKSIAHGLIVPASPVLSLASVILFLGLAGWVIMAVVKSKNNRVYYRLGAWMLPYFVFFSFWDHRNTEFKLQVLLPFILLVILSSAALVSQLNREKRILLGSVFLLVILGIGFINISFFLVPANDLSSNRNWLVAEAVGEATPSNTFILVGGCGSDLSIHNKIYIPYFALRRTFILDWRLGKGMSLEDIYKWIKQERSKGTPVYFFSEILRDSQALRQLLKNHNLEEREYFNFIDRLTASKGENSEEKRIPLPDGHYLVPAL